MNKLRMFYRFVFFLLLIILVIGFNKTTKAQGFVASTVLESTTNITITSSDKVDDGIIVFGYYRGTLNTSPAYTADLFDMFLAKYDNDFQLLWIKSIGGPSLDFSYDLKVSSDGSIYIAGTFKDKCGFSDTDTLTSDGLYDSFLAKYSSSGNLNWAKKIASNPANQYGTSIDIEESGDIIYGGYYSDSVDIFSDKYINSNGLYIVKLDNSGNLIWSKDIKTKSVFSRITTIRSYSDGYYINGDFQDTVFFDTGNEISQNLSNTDVFLYKVSSNDGSGFWLRRSFADSEMKTGAISSDAAGNIYYTGYFEGASITVDSTASATSHIIYNNGNRDIFVFKYKKAGDLIWANNYGGTGEERARGIKFKDRFIYFTGYFTDQIIFDQDTLSSSGSSIEDIFIGVINREGVTIRAKSIQGNDYNDSGTSISIDDQNFAYLGGFFNSTSVQVGDSTYTNPSPGSSVLLIAKYKPEFSIAFTSKINLTCNQSNDGQLIVTPYFGAAPYTYAWSHNGTLNDSTATGLSAGTYTVTVTDALDSTDVAQYTLTEPGAFVFNPAITQVTTCSYNTNGAIDLNVTGGNGGNGYQWVGFGTENVEDQTNLGTGSYSVTVTDSESCTGDTTINITGPESVTFGNSVVTAYTGADPTTGKVNLELLGGTGTPSAYAASWSGPSSYTATTQDITGLAAGNYTVTATDASACDFDTTFAVLDHDNLYAYISSSKDACNGTTDGKATVSYYSPDGSTDITYLWNDPTSQTTETATNLAPGRYYVVTITDVSSSETSKDSVFINELTYVFAGSLSGTTALDCKGDDDGTIDLSITTDGITPYSYSWSNSATTQDISGLAVGTYSVTTTDDNECTFSITNYSITEPQYDLAASASIVTEPLCNGELNGEIRVDANGGNNAPYTYQWDDPGSQTSQIANGLDAGYYNVIVTDFKGCTATASVNLTEPDALSLSGAITHLNCFGDNNGVIDITVGGGTPTYSYSWTTADGTGLAIIEGDQSGLISGTYKLTVTDGNSCEIADTFVLTEPIELTIDTESKTDITTCNGDNTGSITIVASGGTAPLQYSIDDGTTYQSTGTFTGLTASTNYIVKVKDANDCDVTGSTLTISEPTAINISNETATNISCNGSADGQILITASGGTGSLSYSIDNGTTYQASGTFINLTASTNYIVKVKDANDCDVTGSTLTISEPTAISISSETPINITCNGAADGQIVITASGGTGSLQYSIDNGTTYQTTGTFTDLTAGTNYIVKVKDDNDCEVTGSTLTISEPTVINISGETATNISCNGAADGQIVIVASGGTGSLQYSIDNGTTYQTTGTFTDLTAGTNYIVKVKDDNDCEVTGSTLIISEPTVISIDTESSIDATSQTAADGSITVGASGGTGILSYTLTPEDIVNETGIFTGIAPNDYIVNVTDENLCGPVSSNTITVGFPNAIDDISNSDLVKLYPNPTSGKLNIEIDTDEHGSCKIEILTMSGQIIFQKEVEFFGKLVNELDLSTYSKGIYIVRVTGNTIHYKEKILLQ